MGGEREREREKEKEKSELSPLLATSAISTRKKEL